MGPGMSTLAEGSLAGWIWLSESENHVLSAVPHGLKEGVRFCNGSLTAGLWQQPPVPSQSEPKRERRGRHRVGGGERARFYHNMEFML